MLSVRGRLENTALGTFWWLVFAVLSALAVVPLFCAEHPPLQDLPQHLAAIRVLRDHPELGLGEYFDIALARTQYLAYYLAAWLLSYVFGVTLANKLLLAAAIVALPWSLAALLRALGRDPRLAVFAFGLTYNAHLVLGFFNFIAALPLVFYGLTSAVHARREPSRGRSMRLAIWLVLCFYTHVVPFAFLALGSALVLLGDGIVSTLRRAIVFAPATIASLVWLRTTPAGSATLAAASGGDGAKGPRFASVSEAIRELPQWLTDVLSGHRDEQLLVVWGALLLAACAIGTRPAKVDGPASEREVRDPADLGFRVGLLCPVALVAYFVAPVSYDWIWPISARFPLLALLFAVALVPRPRGSLGSFTLAGAALVAALSFVEAARAFAAFDREEVGEFEGALAAIPEGERVVGLIFSRGSEHVRFSPFLHYAALYQAEKGGAVMFSFADFPQSPFRFKDHRRPPRVRPRWEWQPERVDPERDLDWYEYVLVRGGPGAIAHQAGTFARIFQGDRWSVFRRR